MDPPACRGTDPRHFDSTTIGDHLAVRRLCDHCPHAKACLATALTIANSAHIHHGTPDGTWGGLLWRDGQIVPVSVGLARLELAGASKGARD